MNSLFKVRQDILFGIDDRQFNLEIGEYPLNYSLNDFIVRIETLNTQGDPVIRYGVMVDFEDHGNLWKKSYVLEIPSSAKDPQSVQKDQETVIKSYIDQMRQNWQSFLAEQIGENKTITIDEYDKIQRTIRSCEGRWNILMRFYKSTHYISFFKWLFKTDNSKKDSFNKELVRFRMPFVVGNQYRIHIDWALPYICYEKDYKVSHFKSDAPSEQFYYPFHNFLWQDQKYGTDISIDGNKDYQSEYEQGIELKPSNYVLLGYYLHFIDAIDRLKYDNYKELEPYYIYLNNLNIIQTIMTQTGPLAKIRQSELEQLLTSDLAKDWDGNVKDTDEQTYKTHIALGVADIVQMRYLFADIIKNECVNGRNANRSVQIEGMIHSLYKAFITQNQFAQNLFEDLWAFNRDRFGIDLYFEKLMLFMSQSKEAQQVYDEYLKQNLYEHPILEDPSAGYDKNPPDPYIVPNMCYRAENILTDIWQIYYQVREKVLLASNQITRAKMVNSTPGGGEIAAKLVHGPIENLDYTPGLAGHGTPPQYYKEWKLSDEQIRKVANYLMGGDKIDDIKKVESEIMDGIKRILGDATYKEIPFNKLDEISRMAVDVKAKFFERVGVKSELPSHIGGGVIALTNILIAKIAFENSFGETGSTVDKFKAMTVAMGVASDVGNFIAGFYGIEATLSREALIKIGSVGARRVAIGLGALEATAGSVGGVLGGLWFIYDSFGAWNAGYRKNSFLDILSSIGCGISTVGLFLNTSIVGIEAGVICCLIGFVIVIASQTLKFFNSLSNKPEIFCRDLFNKPLPENCMEQMKYFKDELKNNKIIIPWEINDDVEQLTDRICEFLSNIDTFKHFPDKLPNKI